MPKNDDGPQNGGAIEQPDFEKAARLLKHDVKPAEEKVGEHAQVMSTAYKAIKKDCHVNPAAAKLAYKLSRQSEEKTDDYLRSLRGMLEALNVGITRDLVDEAEGAESAPIIPTVERSAPVLETIN